MLFTFWYEQNTQLLTLLTFDIIGKYYFFHCQASKLHPQNDGKTTVSMGIKKRSSFIYISNLRPEVTTLIVSRPSTPFEGPKLLFWQRKKRVSLHLFDILITLQHGILDLGVPLRVVSVHIPLRSFFLGVHELGNNLARYQLAKQNCLYFVFEVLKKIIKY